MRSFDIVSKKESKVMKFYLFLGIFLCSITVFASERERVCAFLRVKNEIKTIEACLNSIDGVFDKIVIIHSNEPDDGSIDLMNKWCGERSYCEIHEYPYRVIPSHSEEYKMGLFDDKNSLAAYYNWGLQFFEPEDWVVKIDGDQVYLKEKLKSFILPFREGKVDDTKRYALCGYNSFVRNKELVLFRSVPINGSGGDSFFVKRKYIKPFIQSEYFEINNILGPVFEISEPVWFHFMKSLKSHGNIKSNEQATLNEIQYLSSEQKDIFEKNIRPLLKNSPYYSVKVSVEK